MTGAQDNFVMKMTPAAAALPALYLALFVAGAITAGVIAGLAYVLIVAVPCCFMAMVLGGNRIRIARGTLFTSATPPKSYIPHRHAMALADIAAVTIATRNFFEVNDRDFTDDGLKRLLVRYRTMRAYRSVSTLESYTRLKPILFVKARPDRGADFSQPLEAFSVKDIAHFADALRAGGVKVMLDDAVIMPKKSDAYA
jgi:hypothetical protein